jgi:uncharacterized protein with von Willebrand factor type A (vWA) domain
VTQTPETYQLPLRAFFQALRRYGFPLGVDDYLLLVEALNGGFGLKDETDLLNVCRAIWFKPNQSRDVFEHQFHKALHFVRQRVKIQKGSKSEEPKPIPTPPVTEPRNRQDSEPETQTKKRESSTPDTTPEKDKVPSPQEFIYLNISSTTEREGGRLPSDQEISKRVDQYDFLFQGGYRVLWERQLQHSWANLPDNYESYPTEEIDLEASLELYARRGNFDELVFQTRQVGVSRVLILIDHASSMLAFHDLAEQIADSAPVSESHLPNKYYFHDIPLEYLYRDPAQMNGDRIADLARYFLHRKTNILVISDAGAARGMYEAERVLDTRDSLQQLAPLANRIVWLNPVPKARWSGTTAEQIARHLVPMFEISDLGLQRAVNTLKGRNKPHLT